MTSTARLTKAVSWLGFGNAAVRALSLVTMPLLTRWLSPAAYGEAALVSTVVSLASVFALAGMDMSYSRHYFANDPADSDAIEIFCWRVVLGLTLVFAAVAALAWIGGISHWLGMNAGFVGFVTIGIAASALSTMAQTRARLQGRYRAIAVALWISGVAAAVTTLSVAHYWRQDAWPLLLAMMVGYVLPILWLGVPAPAKLLKNSGLSRNRAWSIASVGLAGIITAPAYWILSTSDRWFLARFHGADEVGIYSIGFTVGTLGMMLNTAIISAWLPELARLESVDAVEHASERGRLVQLLAAAMLIVWLAVVSSGGDVIRALADSRFHGAAIYVPYLAAGVLFHGCLHVGNALLVMARKLHWSAAAWSVAVAVCITLNYWLVPRYSGLGAAVTQFVSFLVVAVLVWVAVSRFAPMRLDWKRIGVGAIIAAVTGSAMSVPWNQSAWLSLAVKFPMGLSVAVLLLWILAPDVFSRWAKGRK